MSRADGLCEWPMAGGICLLYWRLVAMYLLPPLCFAALLFRYLALRLREAGCPTPLREALLATAITAGVAVTLITEFLSLLRALSPLPVFLAWALLALAVFGLTRFRPARPATVERSSPQWCVTTRITAVGIAGILAVTLLVALAAPPNTWDSMTYHMSRVMHWIQNASLAFFPASEVRELWPYPWAEYAILHLQLLSGGDRFANLVQWFASVISAAGVSLIVRFFTTDTRAQWLAALLSLTIPMGILQATSTQNDLATAAWLVCFVYYLLKLSEDRSNWLYPSVAAGCALGLGALTKPLIAFYGAGFFMWTTLRNGGLRQIPRIVRSSAIIGGLALLLCAGHLLRIQTSDLHGAAAPMWNAEISPRVAVSNLVRGLTLHLGTASNETNEKIQVAVVALHGLLGLGPEDEKTTHPPGHVRYRVTRPYIHEDHLGNRWHLLLGFAALLWCFWEARRSQSGRRLLFHTLSIAAATLLICAAIRWSPWRSRFHLALFVMAAPLIAVFLTRIAKGRLAGIAAALLCISSIPYLLDNHSRPLKGDRSILKLTREEALFNNRPNLREPYARAVEFVESSGCSRIGLILVGEVWEYPIWSLARDRFAAPPSIRHVNAGPPGAGPAPCALITHKAAAPVLAVGKQPFRRALETQELLVYLPEE